MNDNTGGPALPFLQFDSANKVSEQGKGMSLRDYLAAKAMQGLLASWPTGLPPANMLAPAAYQYADEMLKAREQ